jgi:predicted N-acetyltransferase YhbS
MSISIRPVTSADISACGQICYDAFHRINTSHNFPPDFPNVDTAMGLIAMLANHPEVYGVVAENDGRIVGSNFIDERSAIFGIGPITVDPSGQNSGVGRRLMEAVMQRAAERGAPGVRLVQAAFHNRSLSLYTKLGFDPREPLSCFQGTPLARQTPGYEVRPAEKADIAACNELCFRVHGHTRPGELRDAIAQGTASVAVRGNRITGYATSIAFFGHAVAETNADLAALIAAAPAFPGPGFLLPTRNAEMMRWCLGNGLRVTQPMTLMSHGLYNEPRGAYLPSVSF